MSDKAGAASEMKRAVFFSDHVFSSRRKAGLHWLASAWVADGYDVLFITTGASQLGRIASKLRPDPKYHTVDSRNTNRIRMVEPHLHEMVLYGCTHPMWLYGAGRFLPLGRTTLGSWIRHLEVAREWIAGASEIIFESGPGLLLVDHVRSLNPQAALIYRVSDDLSLLDAHPTVMAAEKAAVPRFGLISVPSPTMALRFSDHPRVRFHSHGVDKQSFRKAYSNPFHGSLRKVVSVGNMLFDYKCAETIADDPQLELHVFGAVRWQNPPGNVVLHGEQPFSALLPWIQHADVAAALYAPKAGFEYLAYTSNKVLQYLEAGKPVVIPEALVMGRPGLFGYHEASRESVGRALTMAMTSRIPSQATHQIFDWKDVQQLIVADLASS